MIRLLALCVLCAAIVFSTEAATPPNAATSNQKGSASPQELKIGDAAPDFSLPGIDGKTHTLADYKGAQVLMVAFLSNHCPDSQAAEGRIKAFVETMKGKSFALVAINPNNPDAVRDDELGYSKSQPSHSRIEREEWMDGVK